MNALHKSLRSLALVAALSGLVVGLTACPSGPKECSCEDKTFVACVNGEGIARTNFDQELTKTKARFQKSGREIAPALETRLKENLMRKLVEETMISQRAKTEGVTVEAAEIDAKFAEHKSRFGNDEAFAKFLERTNQTAEAVKDDLRRNLLRDKLLEKVLKISDPTEADAQKYYDENLDKYKQKEQIKASHILIKTEKNDDEATKKKKLEQAKKVLAEVKKKGADFEAVAKQYSDGPTKEKGGDLGTFSRGRMVKPFEDAAFAANAGDIIGPIETQFGYHVIKVYEKLPERQRPFAEVKEEILKSLKTRQQSKAKSDFMKTMREGAKTLSCEAGIDLNAKQTGLPPGAKPELTPEMREAAQKAIKEGKEQLIKEANENIAPKEPVAPDAAEAGKDPVPADGVKPEAAKPQ